jgi:hypothetical protein
VLTTFCFVEFQKPYAAPSINSTPAHWDLFGASGSLREPHTQTTAVLPYELDASFLNRLDNSFDSPALRS